MTIIGIREHLSWPIKPVPVAKFYNPTLEDGCDEAAVTRYMKQIKSGRYEPVRVSSRYSDTDVLDGSHRIIAAHRLGVEFINAYVDPTSSKVETGS